MLIESNTSKTKKSLEKKEEYTINEPIQPILDFDTDLDAQIKSLQLEKEKLNLGNSVKINMEQKNLSILKKVNGVINYFQEIKKDKEKNYLPKYLFDLTLDILYLKKCQQYTSNSNLCHIRLPLIVISKIYYSNFISFLNNYYLYSEYKENINLTKYLILSSEFIDKYKPFHDSQHNYTFVAECINTGLVNHYDINQLMEINQKLNKYFSNHEIKGSLIDIYYDRWLKDLMKILFNFILFYFDQTPIITLCDKCKKEIMFIEYDFNICNFNKDYLYQQVYQDIKDNQTYTKSIDIANNILNNLELTGEVYNKNKIREDSSVNIIYYDENMINNYKEVVLDSMKFEKECNGTFLLISNIKSFLLILKEFKRKKQTPKFHLICPGSQFENLMKVLLKYENINQIIIAFVIYTLNADKYSYLKQKYNISGIFTKPEEIKEYIKFNKSKNNIKYKVPILITIDDYNDKYIEFHKTISSQYGKLYQKSSYLTALNILEDYLISNNNLKMDSYDINLLLSNLEVFSAPQRDYKKIIQEYTNESFYKLFNKWLNEVDPLAIKKIAFFISGLQLSLNIYGIKEKKGFNKKAELYRGVLFDYSFILTYLKNIGNIIVFPSFFSTTLDKEIAKDFSHYNNSRKERDDLFSTTYIIYINPKNDWIAQGFSIDAISYYQNEKEILFQPFCFFKLLNLNVDMDNYTCFIYLELIGKKEIWERKMNKKCVVSYVKEDNFVKLNKF